MLNILLMIILIIIVFIIILLYMGVRITLIYNKTGSELKGCLKILILKKIKIYTVHFPKKSEDEKEDRQKKEKDRDHQKIFKLLKPCFKHFKEFLKSFVKCISVSKLENHVVFGLDSYADTAKYIGYIWSLLIVVNSTHKNANLTAVPSFNGSTFDIKGDNEVDINLLKLMPPAIKLISKKDVRNLIGELRNG